MINVHKYQIRSLLTFGLFGLLSACGDVSDDVVQRPSFEVALEQCEDYHNQVIGEVLEPITIDGNTVQACLLKPEAGLFSKPAILKSSHNYESLVWVLDGQYEVGTSQAYQSVDEFLADIEQNEYSLQQEGGGFVYAKPGTQVIVHRNGYAKINIRGLEEQPLAAGKWAGMVVHGIGSHPECENQTQSTEFCNIQGEYGYYGGVSRIESYQQETLLKFPLFTRRLGVRGKIFEAGGATQDGESFPAALTIMTPHYHETDLQVQLAYSAAQAVSIHGGESRQMSIYSRHNARGLEISDGFSGNVSGIFYQQDTAPSVTVKNSGSQDYPVVLGSFGKLYVLDPSLSNSTAIQTENSLVSLQRAVLSGQQTCLRTDSATVSINDSLLNCGVPIQSSQGAAEAILSAATATTTENPAFDIQLAFTNANAILPEGTIAEGVNGLNNNDSELYAYQFDACYGVGTLLDESRVIGQTEYALCELSGEITQNLQLTGSLNGQPTAWVFNGDVRFGAANGQPYKLIIASDTQVFAKENARIYLSSGVNAQLKGTQEHPLSIHPYTENSFWNGLTLEGPNADLSVRYLRLFNAGDTQAALTLKAVGPETELSFIDINGAKQTGLMLDGGQAVIKNLLVANVIGDQISWQNGFQGAMQQVIVQAPDNVQGVGLNGINNSQMPDSKPRSKPSIANLTLSANTKMPVGVLLADGSGLNLFHSVISGPQACLDIDGDASAALIDGESPAINFSEVVLDCNSASAADDEHNGQDHSQVIVDTNLSVYPVTALLDKNYLPTGDQVPAFSSTIDFSNAGDMAQYLNNDLGYPGAVANSQDDWFVNWSDSVGLVLAPECDELGVLETGFSVNNANVKSITLNEFGQPLSNARPFTICRLVGPITEDLTLPAFTGPDRLAMQAQESTVTVEQDGQQVEWQRPMRTLWYLTSMLQVGDQTTEMNDVTEVVNIKENPVTLTIEHSALIMSDAKGGLNITRGGKLDVQGQPHYEALFDSREKVESNTGGPVNFFGLDLHVRTDSYFTPYSGGQQWQGIVVNGFARNNQCPDALAGANSQVCNLASEYGYHGGYDDDYQNLNMQYVNMNGGYITLNSANGEINLLNYTYDLVDVSNTSSTKSVMYFNGGKTSLSGSSFNINSFAGPGIEWSHGYQGLMQNLGIKRGLVPTVFENGKSNYYSVGDVNYYYPLMKGRNSSLGNLEIPVSKPTILNATLFVYESLSGLYPEYILSNIIELTEGSGLVLLNSILGSSESDYNTWFTNMDNIGEADKPDYCFKTDSSISELVGNQVVLDQIATSCTLLAESQKFNDALMLHYELFEFENSSVKGDKIDKSSLPSSSSANKSIYKSDWSLAHTTPSSNIYAQEDIKLSDWNYLPFAAIELIQMGEVKLNSDLIPENTKEQLDSANYFGSENYFEYLNTVDPDGVATSISD